MKYSQRGLLFAVLLFLGAITARSASAGSNEKLIITGTGSSIGAMRLMAEGFQTRHPNVTVTVLPSIGTTGAIKAVREDKIDIGLAYRPLKAEERSAGIIEEPYGRTAFIFGVQSSNPVNNVTLAEIEEMYAGKRTTWPEGTPIRLILRPSSDTFSIYLASIGPGMKSALEDAHARPGMFVGGTDQDAALQIEKTPGSFGTTSSSLIAAEKRKIKALSVEGIAPTPANLSAGRYPHVLTLYLVYKTNNVRGALKDFRAFVFSRSGQKLLSDNGHVNLPQLPGR